MGNRNIPWRKACWIFAMLASLAAVAIVLSIIAAKVIDINRDKPTVSEITECGSQGTEGNSSVPKDAVTEQVQSNDGETEPLDENTEDTTIPPETETSEPAAPEPADDQFVKVADYIPDIVTDLRYAGEDNFTGQRIYGFSDAWLRYGTVKKLMAVQADLKERGLSLKIWDAFRPVSAQCALWEVCPDPTYVANPNNGFSSHSRGNTVDVTLVYADGSEAKMPTGFDNFSKLADRDYSDCGEEAARNAKLLEEIMTAHGFSGYFGEWWHFSDTVRYEVEKDFDPSE